jgi:hypothetical protein
MKNMTIATLTALSIALTACGEWTNPIQTTAVVKGDLRYSSEKVSALGFKNSSCGEGWSKFHGTYTRPVPMAGGDTVKPYFWTGLGQFQGADGMHIYGEINTGNIVSDSTKFQFICEKE